MYDIKKNVLYISVIFFSTVRIASINAAEKTPQGDKEVDKLTGLLADTAVRGATKTIKKAKKRSKCVARSLLNLLNNTSLSQDEKIEQLKSQYGSLELGSSFRVSDHQIEESFVPVCVVANNEEWRVVKHLTDKGISVNMQDESGCTPLHYAVTKGDPGPILDLISSGANPLLANDDDETPLDIYKECNDEPNHKVVQALTPKSNKKRSQSC